jgi:hypothetical protein
MKADTWPLIGILDISWDIDINFKPNIRRFKAYSKRNILYSLSVFKFQMECWQNQHGKWRIDRIKISTLALITAWYFDYILCSSCPNWMIPDRLESLFKDKDFMFFENFQISNERPTKSSYNATGCWTSWHWAPLNVLAISWVTEVQLKQDRWRWKAYSKRKISSFW